MSNHRTNRGASALAGLATDSTTTVTATASEALDRLFLRVGVMQDVP